MPLKIGQIDVRMAVQSPDADPVVQRAGCGGSGGDGSSRLAANERDALVAECVRAVLEILQRQSAR